MLLLIFLINTKVVILNQIEVLRQSFISEHALIEQEIAERKNTFQNILTGMDIMLSETDSQRITAPHLTRYIPLSGQTPRAFFIPDDLISERTEITTFRHLAGWVARFMEKEDTTQKGEVLSGYLFHARHGVIDIITNKVSHTENNNIDSLKTLSEEIERAKSGVNYLHNQTLSERIVWLPPINALNTDTKLLRLAAPVMKDNHPFATLVMEFPSPALTSPQALAGSPGFLSLQTQDGTPIAGRKAQAINTTDFDSLMSEAYARPESGRAEAYDWNGLVLLDPLGDTGWVLLFQCSWGEVFSVVSRQIAEVAATTSGMLLLIWCLLIFFKFRIFRPLINQSRQVFESEQLSRTLIDTAPLGLGILDIGNKTFLLSSPMMQQTATRLHASHDSLANKLVQNYSRYTTGCGMTQFEQALRPGEAEAVNLSVSMAPARYQGDDVLVVAFTDITSKKQLEQQLMAAREASDRASAAKSAFLAAMSHEIRTPLNAILGNLELLAQAVPDNLRDRLDIIQRASDSLLLTISDILDFSKIEAGELHLEEIEFDLYVLAADVLAVFSPLAHAKGVLLSGEIGNTPSQLMRGDPTALRQILNNLLTNALKFTEKGIVRLCISVNKISNEVDITIGDTGIGMTSAQLHQVFQAFRQADETINRRYGGTGLGLALCTGLVNAMSGEMSATSEPGKGSTFRVSLPLGEGITCAEPPRFHQESVTLLCSETVSRSWLMNVLSLWGLTVTAYQHPAQISAQSESCHTLIIWGDRSTWHWRDEKRVIALAEQVIDCRYEGPTLPMLNGHIYSVSIGNLKGLFSSLSACIQHKALPERVLPQMQRPGNLHVLVVEDNPVNRHLLMEQLQLLGCRVTLAKEGKEAVMYLQLQTFDIVLTDLCMPEMDGYTLARRIRDDWPTLPVIAVTASVTQQEYEECEDAGMTRVLYKPLLLNELSQVLLEVCQHSPTSPMMQSWEARHTHRLPDLLGGNAMPDEIHRLFEQACAESIHHIWEAIRHRDTSIILRELHSLKGAFGVFGMEHLKAETSTLSEEIKGAGLAATEGALRIFCQKLEPGVKRS
ncbi:hypothetical protein YA49_06455 [Enterobacter cloacae subsp. cloacae]|nr:hypothetical protein YA49_06455 [Enterobacter cloacae subsp. cloacae]